MTPYYRDEYATLYHGDCRDITEWLTADVLVTDPPYGIGWKQGENKRAGSYARTGITNDTDTSLRDTILAEWGQRPGIVFGSFRAPFPHSFRQVLVWKKSPDAGVVGSTTGYRTDTELVFLTGTHITRTPARSSVLTTPGGMAQYRTGHPHAKPSALIELLTEWTTGTVADPFAGSGSTLVAAKNLGRKSIGIEIEERYCEIAAKRLTQDVLIHHHGEP